MTTAISLTALLPADHILLLTECQNKKRVFEQATLLLENINSKFSRNELFQMFIERERMGSTSIGCAGAIPHVHIEIDKPLCVLTQLKNPVQYDADNAPASLVQTMLFLIAPKKEPDLHLKLLAVFSLLLSDETLVGSLGECTDNTEIHQKLTVWENNNGERLDEIWQGQ